ncbi:MAG: LON peptidase substrate-binding domain-containing protein [Myxococcales bacterium]|nr:LON peptidase substrate-binding domain-containing protein [Myxococcales bacterium]
MDSDLDLSELRIFPLPNLVLFPSVRLPLHIFEPRYRELTRDALAGDRVIAMVLLQDNAASGVQAHPAVYEVGCAGRVVGHEALSDGRYQLLLEGQSRIRITQELRTREPFRRVRAEAWPELPGDGRDPELLRELDQIRQGIEKTVLGLTRRDAPATERQVQERLRQLDSIELVNLVCFGLDCSPVEKQALLEAPELVRRARMLEHLLQFRLAETRLPEGPRTLQ